MLTKNLIALELIFLVISHGIIQFGMFELLEAQNRAEITDLLINGVPENKQVVFSFERGEFKNTFPGIQWMDNNEFRYNDRMFDIIKQEIKGDSVYLYCINDSNESDLYYILDRFIDDETGDKNEQYGLNNFFNQYYSCSIFHILLKALESDIHYSEKNTNTLLEGEYFVNTPPPRA